MPFSRLTRNSGEASWGKKGSARFVASFHRGAIDCIGLHLPGLHWLFAGPISKMANFVRGPLATLEFDQTAAPTRAFSDRWLHFSLKPLSPFGFACPPYPNVRNQFFSRPAK